MATKTVAVEAVDMAATAEPEDTMIAVVAAAAVEDTMTAEAQVVTTAEVVAATIVVAMIGTAACT